MTERKRNPEATCGNCPCFYPGLKKGECRIGPPTPTEEHDLWPMIKADDWCREHPDFFLPVEADKDYSSQRIMVTFPGKASFETTLLGLSTDGEGVYYHDAKGWKRSCHKSYVRFLDADGEDTTDEKEG